MSKQESRESYVIDEIIYNTRLWEVPDWYKFRNVFITNYYELRLSEKRADFNEWKIKKIKEFNLLNNNKKQ
jgi:hypothetical protein